MNNMEVGSRKKYTRKLRSGLCFRNTRDTRKTKSLLRADVAGILRRIAGYTVMDRKRNTEIRDTCKIQE